MSTKLNEKQLIAVHLLASGVRASIIAKEIGIREETLSRWRQIDEFKKALEDATEVVLREIDDTHKNLLIRAQNVINEAAKSVKNIKSVYIVDMQVTVNNNKIKEYRVNTKVTFGIIDN